MSHRERKPPRTIQGRVYGSHEGALVLDGTERGDTHVTARLQVGNAPTDEAAELSTAALRALICDLQGRLDVLEAYAPEGVR